LIPAFNSDGHIAREARKFFHRVLFWCGGSNPGKSSLTNDGNLGNVPGEGWKRFRRWLGDLHARLILTVLYFAIVSPFALVVRWDADPLSIKPGTPQGWRLKGDTKG